MANTQSNVTSEELAAMKKKQESLDQLMQEVMLRMKMMSQQMEKGQELLLQRIQQLGSLNLGPGSKEKGERELEEIDNEEEEEELKKETKEPNQPFTYCSWTMADDYDGCSYNEFISDEVFDGKKEAKEDFATFCNCKMLDIKVDQEFEQEAGKQLLTDSLVKCQVEEEQHEVSHYTYNHDQSGNGFKRVNWYDFMQSSCTQNQLNAGNKTNMKGFDENSASYSSISLVKNDLKGKNVVLRISQEARKCRVYLMIGLAPGWMDFILKLFWKARNKQGVLFRFCFDPGGLSILLNLLYVKSVIHWCLPCIGLLHVAHPIDFENKETEDVKTKRAIEGAISLMRSCQNLKTVKRVVYTSSVSAVVFKDHGKDVVDENHWSGPDIMRKMTTYGASYMVFKTLTAQTALGFAEENGIDFVPVIPIFVNGPFVCPCVPGSVYSSLGMVFGDEHQYGILTKVQMVHVDDVASAHIYLFENPEAKRRYNCSSKYLTSNQISEFLSAKYLEYPIRTPEVLEDYEKNFIYYASVSTNKLLDTGFQFKYGLEEMYDNATVWLNIQVPVLQMLCTLHLQISPF